MDDPVPDIQGVEPTHLLNLSKTHSSMSDNPKADWKMADVERLCSEVGLTWSSPKRGSHYKVRSELVSGTILTIPKARPIKAPYIRQLVFLASRHIEAVRERNANV